MPKNAPKSMQSPRLPELSTRTTLTPDAARAGGTPSSPARAASSKCPARSRSICIRRTFGELAQKLGGHLRFKTSVPPRLSEFAILCTGAAVEGAIRMGDACADGGEARRQAGDHPRHSSRPRAEIGAEGRDGDL